MNIEKRILDLLYFKDCVIIPGLGGFVSHYVPAKIKEETQTLVPPSKKIGFNTDLLHDDGLLSGYLVDFNRITLPVARKALDEFVDKLKIQIASGTPYIIEDVGTFSYSKTGELLFSSSKEINLLSDSFGLKAFHFTRPERAQMHPMVRRAVRDKKSNRPISLPGSTVNNLRRIAVAIPLLLAVSLLPVNKHNGFGDGQQSATLSPFPTKPILEQTHESNLFEQGNEQNSGTLNSYELNTGLEKAGDVINEPFDKNSFAIIAGSFSTEKNAGILKDELLEKGFKPEIWKAPNGFHRVVIQAYESLSRAKEAVAKLEEDLQNIDFWILQ
jgi:hypothetical protein